MAKKKKTKIAIPSELSIESPIPPSRDHVPPSGTSQTSFGLFKQSKSLIIGILVLLLIGLFLTNKGLLVAAVVNGKPIFRWDLTRTLTSRFGQQTIESMINERLIADAAKKAGVSVSQGEVDAKEQDIVKGLGENVKLEDLLKYQGMTKSDFDSQIRLQMTVQKILGKDIVLSDADIDNFIATNRAVLRATDPGKLKDEARQAILDKKIGEKIQPWFLELKQKANVLKFL